MGTTTYFKYFPNKTVSLRNLRGPQSGVTEDFKVYLDVYALYTGKYFPTFRWIVVSSSSVFRNLRLFGPEDKTYYPRSLEYSNL